MVLLQHQPSQHDASPLARQVQIVVNGRASFSEQWQCKSILLVNSGGHWPGAVSLRSKGAGFDSRSSNHAESLTFRRRRAFVITDTELKLIAAAAIIGLSNRPKNGYRIPAAMGTPSE